MVEVLNPLQSMEVDAQRTEKAIENFRNTVQEGYFLLVLFFYVVKMRFLSLTCNSKIHPFFR